VDLVKPSDLLCHIASFLGLRDHFRLARVCKTFQAVCDRPASFTPRIHLDWAWDVDRTLTRLAQSRVRPVSLILKSSDALPAPFIAWMSAGGASRLTELSTSYQAVTEQLIGALPDSTPLRILELMESLDAQHAKLLNRFPLHTLRCDATVVQQLGNVFQSLTSLSFFGATTDADVALLRGCQLQSLSFLWGHAAISDAACHVMASLPLSHLELDSAAAITDAGFAGLKRLKLAALRVYNARLLTAAGFAFISAMPLLSLALLHFRAGDAALVHLADQKQLVTFHLKWSNGITGSGLVHLANLPVVVLNLEGCKDLDSSSLEHLAGICTMRKLDLRHTGCKRAHAKALIAAGVSVTL